MKKSVSSVLLTVILLQSCVVYQKNSVSINEASERGKVKVVNTNGRTVLFDNILSETGSYYGIYDNNRIPIDTIRTTSFYLKKPSYRHDIGYRIWVYRKEGNNGNPTQGYLYEVKDSSILVSSSNPIKKKLVLASSIREFQIYDIDKIKLRRIGNVGRGALVGVLLGAIPAIASSKSLAFGFVIIIISLPIAALGVNIGSAKKSYEINGSIEQYSIYRHIIRDKAFIKPK